MQIPVSIFILFLNRRHILKKLKFGMGLEAPLGITLSTHSGDFVEMPFRPHIETLPYRLRAFEKL
jgi:hypothetical protein